MMALLKPDMGKILYLALGAFIVPMVLPKIRG
jgi:hypothetical protein